MNLPTPPMFLLESQHEAAIFTSGEVRLRIAFLAPAIARLTCTSGKPFSEQPSHIVSAQRTPIPFTLAEDPDSFHLSTSALTVVLSKHNGALSYFNSQGVLLTREPGRGGRWLTPKSVFRNVFARDSTVAYAQSIDGARATAGSFETHFDRYAFEAKVEFVFSPNEALFGFGSHEEGFGNLRGRSRELYQQNMKAVVPAFVSTRGYGILFDCSSLMTFHDDALGSYWWADCVDELDFYFIQGSSFDDITRGFHLLTGPAPMLPKWTFGFVQSKERYVNAAELLAVVREYRRRRIPLDVIVLDWKSWPNGSGWGQKSFDLIRFPDPAQLTAELHALGARLMVSIWPIMTGGCPNQRELLEHNWMLGNQSTYNAFLPAARACYWDQAHSGLFSHGVDAWWCDCTEPFEADWAGAVKPEPHARLSLNTAESKLYLDPAHINAYSLLHSQGIYEGQRRASSSKRVLNLTRSSYAGQHRYATVTWSGDISATWETFRRSIPEALNFCATGEPYWTVDIGGFFLDHNPNLWFWRGDYPEGCRGLTDMNALEPDPRDTGCRDLGFWELYTRWLQFAVFLPMFRSHGTDAAREIWRFGEEGSPFYDTIADFIRLRYRLLPYIYSLAAAVTFESRSMIRALPLEFPQDLATHSVDDQFLFGPALMVCPVTLPMFYEPGSKPMAAAPRSRPVYLPAGQAWFDFWTNTLHPGGHTITADAPLETIPLFVRSGSIVPLTQPQQFVDEIPDAPYDILVYTGADASFSLYEDAGDGYAYEQGEFAFVHFHWTEATRELLISARHGAFPGLIEQRAYNITFLTASARQTHSVRYRGEELRIPHEPLEHRGPA